MLKKITLPVFLLLLQLLFIHPSSGEENSGNCGPQAEQAGGDRLKYSIDAQVDGPLYFHTIACGLLHRYKKLCAMEMVSFDTSGSVYDYYTLEKISLGKAYFWLDENDSAPSVLAFSSKEAAEKFKAAKGRGVIIDYTTLTGRIPN